MSNLITLQIEGLPTDGGHVLVSDFISRLENLLASLNGFDRTEGGTSQPTLNYRIVDARHSSPLTLTLEPVLRKKITNPDPRHIEKRHSRFFRELGAIRDNKPVSPDVDDATLEHLQKLVEGVGQDFKTAKIYNGESSVDLDFGFEANIRKLLNEEDASYGTETGMLEAVNIHGKSRTCWIYPRIGPQKIRCDFLPGTRDLIRENLGKHVLVEGVKYFRPNSPFPFRVSVKEFGPLETESESSLKDIEGMAPNATQELSTIDFIAKLRDEWDE
jgi:hypothetical protein